VSRIFEALRKSQAAREPDPETTAVQPAVHPLRSPQPAVVRAPVERIEILPLGSVAPVDEVVQREMTALRVNLEGALAGPSRSVMLVSGQGGEGTSTIALQFAQCLSRDASLRVLLVDANGRRASDLIEAARAAGSHSERRGRAALDLLPLGDRLRASISPPMAALRDLLETSGAGYDWVILDGPPLLESPEAATLAALVQGAVLVVRAGRTKRPVLVRALDLLRRAGATVLGTVLNRRRLEIPDFIYRRI
jgi:non-specific protein-tyrosine kinase